MPKVKVIKIDINHEALKEAIKEVGRYLVFALLSYFLTELQQWVNIFQLTPEQKVQAVAIGTAILRFLDKWLHERWQLKGKPEVGLFGKGLSF